MRVSTRILKLLAAEVLVLAVVLFSASWSAFGQSDQTRKDLAAAFSKFDVVQINGDLDMSAGTTLSFYRDGGRVEIALVPHDMRAARYRAIDTGDYGETVADRGPVTTFKGSVVGEQGSAARINTNSGRLEGYFTSGDERFFVEPASNYSGTARGNEYVVYRMEDVAIGHELNCTSQLGNKIEFGLRLTDTAMPQFVGGMKHLDLATDADTQYVAMLGGVVAANTEILGILNVIDGLYSDQLHLSISVVFQHTWSAADPYTGADAKALTESFQAYWNAHYPLASTPRDAAHLFSGKPQTLYSGWAFIGTLCSNPTFAYGTSGYVPAGWDPLRYVLVAHEIGHNLGANHAEAAQGCANTIMNEFPGDIPLSFCSYSRNEIGAFLAANGTCVTPRSNFRFDFDNDAKTDISVYRPSDGTWYLNCSTKGFRAVNWGGFANDKIIPADYDGDGRTDFAIWRPTETDNVADFYILNSDGFTVSGYAWGLPGDVPMPGDFDGDHKADIVVYRPSTSYWWLLETTTQAVRSEQFGSPDDIPMVMDNDGDGKDHITVYRPSDRYWYIAKPMANPAQHFDAVQWGLLDDIFVPADYDGDGTDDVAVFRPSNGMWYIFRSSDGGFSFFHFGLRDDVPVPGDYDGDGKADLAVYRSGTWYINGTTAGFSAQIFGLNSDKPIPAAYVQ